METFRLMRHPQVSSSKVRGIEVLVERTGSVLQLRFYVDCDLDDLELPEWSASQRTDRLWQHTCFEAFIGSERGQYCEFNFSPSSHWAAYLFDSYRAGMREWDLGTDPAIGLDASEDHFALEATIEISGLTDPLALSAVIEERDGTKSYWALAHPPGAPDFHHPTCFAAMLPAPKAP